MPSASVDDRREQARRELATTEVRAPVAATLVALFLLTVVAVPVVEVLSLVAGEDAEPPFSELPVAAAEALRVAREQGPIAADRVLLEAMDAAERRLEDESFLRRRLLPPAQALLLRALGQGNEQVYPGRGDWLFFRADVDHVTGPGYLEPDALTRRSRSGESWEPAPRPDPRPALLALDRELDRRGIRLIVMPTPVKPSVEPGRFARRPVEPGVRNRSTTSWPASRPPASRSSTRCPRSWAATAATPICGPTPTGRPPGSSASRGRWRGPCGAARSRTPAARPGSRARSRSRAVATCWRCCACRRGASRSRRSG